MTFKHFDFADEDLVHLYAKGLVSTNPKLGYLESEKVIYNKGFAGEKVVVLSGGGSGHEPTHGGFVGKGMLDIAVCGNVFASPSAKQVLTGLKLLKGNKGTLVIVKNYTGDILHFGLASEKARVMGSDVEMIVVGDDVSVGKAKNGLVGRRGLSGTVLVHKIAGALAENGEALSSLKKKLELVVANLVTITSSLDHCSVPGRPVEHHLAANEVEIGMGIHNESGTKRLASIPKIRTLIDELLKYLIDPTDEDRAYTQFDKDDDVVLMVNNLGGISELELVAIGDLVLEQLKANYQTSPKRVYIGTFTTSLNGNGFSITLLNATKAGGQEILSALDQQTEASGWKTHIENYEDAEPADLCIATEETEVSSSLKVDEAFFEKILRNALGKLIAAEPQITLFDSIVGDGDCGETLVAGANAILEALDSKKLPLGDLVGALFKISDLIEDSMGGTSGGIYSIFISALTDSLRQLNQSGTTEISIATLSSALSDALEALYKYTRARIGDRTLIDTLAPFVEALKSGGDLKAACVSAQAGSDHTKTLKAKFGRASYVSEKEFAKYEGGVPDPGALGLNVLLQGLSEFSF